MFILPSYNIVSYIQGNNKILFLLNQKIKKEFNKHDESNLQKFVIYRCSIKYYKNNIKLMEQHTKDSVGFYKTLKNFWSSNTIYYSFRMSH